MSLLAKISRVPVEDLGCCSSPIHPDLCKPWVVFITATESEAQGIEYQLALAPKWGRKGYVHRIETSALDDLHDDLYAEPHRPATVWSGDHFSGQGWSDP